MLVSWQSKGEQNIHEEANQHIILYVTPSKLDSVTTLLRTFYVKLMHLHIYSPFSTEVCVSLLNYEDCLTNHHTSRNLPYTLTMQEVIFIDKQS